MMRKPFFIMRIVLLVLVFYMNVLALGFAAWDISAMSRVGASSFGPPIFVIFNACLLIVCIALAFAEKVVPSVRTAQVNIECGWTGVLSSLQLAAAVNITVLGPPNACYSQTSANACAASNVLVSLTWVSSLTLLIYFFVLLVTTISHMEAYPGVWRNTVYNAPWFEERDLRNLTLPTTVDRKERPRSFESQIFGSYDATTPPPPKSMGSPSTVQSFRPTWAKDIQHRRGVDNPFGIMPLRKIVKSVLPGPPPSEKITPFQLPPLEIPAPVHNHADHVTPKATRGISYAQFPQDIADPDKPIAFSRFSEWVRADPETSFSVHKASRLSPV